MSWDRGRGGHPSTPLDHNFSFCYRVKPSEKDLLEPHPLLHILQQSNNLFTTGVIPVTQPLSPHNRIDQINYICAGWIIKYSPLCECV